jgi:L,D-transpeptidase YcbB
LEMRRNDESQELVDWRKIDWSKANMNNYVAWQPPGSFNQLGLVKFSFPSKHRVFMHDTPDKYMFNWSRRANSHGCMRIRNPLQMATVVLGADKGWDRAKIDDLVKNGPDHNIIELDKKIPVHITYFTARVAKGGKISTWGDIYGHEKRMSLALAGKWDKIAVPRDHLAPLDQTAVPRVAARNRQQQRSKEPDSVQSLVNAVLGGF